MLRGKRAQSTLEYALLITAVLLAILYGANQVIRKRLQETMNTSDAMLGTSIEKLNTSFGTSETGG
jgi:uncharacterized protein (UPF0333 family)